MIGILSDAHGNLPAFELALERLERAGARSFVFLGDAVGYIPGAAVLDAIGDRAGAITCVRGNHDAVVCDDTVDAARDDVFQHRQTRMSMSPAAFALIGSWPAVRRMSYPAGRVLMVHGSPADPIAGYVYPDTDLSGFTVDEAFVFMGHTHRPFVRRCGHTTFVNVGSCGLPRDDGRSGAAALFDELTGDVEILRFDIERVTRDWVAAIPGVHPSVLQLVAPGVVAPAGGVGGR